MLPRMQTRRLRGGESDVALSGDGGLTVVVCVSEGCGGGTTLLAVDRLVVLEEKI